MEEQRDRSREEIKEMDRVKKSVESLLQQLEAEGLATDSASDTKKAAGSTVRDETSSSKHTVEDARKIWSLLGDLGKD